MEPGEALGIAAQIAVALAGFAGVVVVFVVNRSMNGRQSTNFGYGFCSPSPSCRWVFACWDYCCSPSNRFNGNLEMVQRCRIY